MYTWYGNWPIDAGDPFVILPVTVTSGATAFEYRSSIEALLLRDCKGLLKSFHSTAELADAIKTKPRNWRHFISNDNHTSTEVRKHFIAYYIRERWYQARYHVLSSIDPQHWTSYDFTRKDLLRAQSSTNSGICMITSSVPWKLRMTARKFQKKPFFTFDFKKALILFLCVYLLTVQ